MKACCLRSSEKVISTNALEAGIRQLLNKLDDLSVDVPKAHIHIGKVLADLIGEGVVDLKTIGRHILEADAEAPPEGEDTMMVSGGLASKLIGVILESLKTAKGERELAAAWGLTGLDYKDFLPSQDRSNPQEQEAFLAEYKLVDVL